MKDGTCPKCSSTDVRITTVINTELMTSAYEFDTYLRLRILRALRRGPGEAGRGRAGMAAGHRMKREARRELLLTADMLRAYSRRGNYHSEPDDARRLGLPGLVAQGLQVAGPAYGTLLDEWGEDFLAQGELELKFVGMVLDDQTVDAAVTIDDDEATLEITNQNTGKVAAVGTARRATVSGPGARGAPPRP